MHFGLQRSLSLPAPPRPPPNLMTSSLLLFYNPWSQISTKSSILISEMSLERNFPTQHGKTGTLYERRTVLGESHNQWFEHMYVTWNEKVHKTLADWSLQGREVGTVSPKWHQQEYLCRGPLISIGTLTQSGSPYLSGPISRLFFFLYFTKSFWFLSPVGLPMGLSNLSLSN